MGCGGGKKVIRTNMEYAKEVDDKGGGVKMDYAKVK